MSNKAKGPQPPAEAQPGSAVFNCPNCPVAVRSQWLTPECPECGERCFPDPSAAPQPPAGVQAENTATEALEYVFGKMPTIGWRKIIDERLTPPWPLEHHARAMGLFRDNPPPSAPVGVEGLRRMVEKLAAHVRPTCRELWEEAQTALAQQPAPVWVAARRRDVRLWMRHNAGFYDTAMELAEAADKVFNLPGGGLDNETHWVWDEAAEAVDDYQRGTLA